MMRVKKSQLGPMEPIARGGVGQVYRLTAPTIPGLSPPLAYKEILADLAAATRASAVRSMEQAVALREAMDPADRAELDRFTTWPLATVEEGGTTVGTVMPLIPPEFFVTVNRQGQAPESKVFAFAYLCASDSYMARMGIDRAGANDPLVRLSLAAQLAYVVGLLHKHRIVYGDLSLANVAIALNPPSPRLLLLDCDAVAALSDAQRDQMHSPFFKPPENQSAAQSHQDLVTDVYKLGLCVLRGLVTGGGVTQLTNPAVLTGTLDREGLDLIKRAISPDRALRPTAKEMCQYLERTVISKAKPPVLESVRLSRNVMVRGRDVIVTWTAAGVQTLRILGSNGYSVEISDPQAHPNGYAITPPTSGDIYLEASNRHGTVLTRAGFIDLYELPSFDRSQAALPRPAVPALAPVQVPTVLSALPARPMVTVDTHPLPRLEPPDLRPLLQTLNTELTGDPLRLLAVAGTVTREAFRYGHRAANERVGAVIGEVLQSTMDSVGSAIGESMADLHARLARVGSGTSADETSVP